MRESQSDHLRMADERPRLPGVSDPGASRTLRMTRNELDAVLARHIEEHPEANFVMNSVIRDVDPVRIMVADEFVNLEIGHAIHPYVALTFRTARILCVYCYQPAPRPIYCPKCGDGNGRDSFTSNRPFCSEFCHSSFADKMWHERCA